MWYETVDRQDTDEVKSQFLAVKDLAEEICRLTESTHELEIEIEFKRKLSNLWIEKNKPA